MQYMGNNFATPPDGGISIQTALPLEYLLYANSSRTATSYSGQPTFYASPGDAHFYGLSGWASTSIWSSFAGGSTVWGDHQMHGAGHIAIQRGSDYLLVNNGQWKGTDGISGSPTIDDSVNSWRTNTLYFNDGSSLTDGDQYVGGQGYWGTTDLFASGIGTNYLYAKSNLVSAYPNGPNYPYNGNSTLLTFIRSYVFLGDHYWVVWDRATDALSTYTMNLFWHFNLNGEPTISGNTLTSTTGSSVLYVTTLLPSGASISVAGDGVASFTDSTISTYRGIIANSVSGTTLNVLTVMDADAAATSEPAVSSITVGSGNMVGAQIADATPRAVLFSSDGTAQTSVTYSTTYSGTGRNVVADLSPGTYKAVVNGSTVASGLSVASGNGTLTFTSGSGTVLISQQVNAGTQLSGVASGVIQ
jgi:heparinase II-like protein